MSSDMRKLRVADVTLPVSAESWEDLQTLASHLPGWVFRGQRVHSRRLEPTLERFVRERSQLGSQAEVEHQILSQFRRSGSRFLSHAPPPEDAMSWLAIIQHYGGPTRLLDFTSSLDVATFFALEQASDSGHCVVWAVNDIVVRGILEEVLRDADGQPLPCRSSVEAGELLNFTIDAKYEGPAACAGTPRFTSDRLNAQKGLFLFGLNLEYSLEENLFGMFGVPQRDVYPEYLVGWLTKPLDDHVLSKLRRRPVVKIFMKNDGRAAVLHNLANRGISRNSLFPEGEDFDAETRDEVSRILQRMERRTS